MGLVASITNVRVTPTAKVVNSVHAQTRVCTDGSSSSSWEETGSFDKSIYNLFSKQDDMKSIQYPSRVRSEFDLYMQYAQAKTIGGVDVSFNSFDEYLGSIGVTNGIC